MSRIPPLLAAGVALGLLSACSSKESEEAYEGEESAAAGNCADGADNDYDGLFDCDDDGCADAEECGGGGSGSDDTGSGGSGSGSGSGGSGSGSGGSGSGGDDSGESPPPVAVLDAPDLRCYDESASIRGTGSYSPDDERRVVGWDWGWSSGDTSESSWTLSASHDEGEVVDLELTAIDDLGQRSETVRHQLTTNTYPDYNGYSVSGDCRLYDANSDGTWVKMWWNEGCATDSSCTCSVTYDIADPDGNVNLESDHAEGYYAAGSVTGTTVTFGFTSDYNARDDWSYYCRYSNHYTNLFFSDDCQVGSTELTSYISCPTGSY